MGFSSDSSRAAPFSKVEAYEKGSWLGILHFSVTMPLKLADFSDVAISRKPKMDHMRVITNTKTMIPALVNMDRTKLRRRFLKINVKNFIIYLLRIARSISEIGFQPVALKMTGWKPIPRRKSDIY